MTTKFHIAFLISAVTAGCSQARDDCGDAYEKFSGKYTGPAIAVDGGDLIFGVTTNCSLRVDGSDQFHQQVNKAWSQAQFGHGLFRAVNVELAGELDWYGGERRIPALRLSERSFVSHEISKADAEAVFYDRMRKSSDGEILD